MTRRYIQLELTSRYTRAFSREAERLNHLAVDMERAQHERRSSPVAGPLSMRAPAPPRSTSPSRA